MSGKLCLLYLDDEESNLRIFQKTFRREYNVIVTSEISEAFKILEEEDVDLILSDHKMPEMTGIDFFKKTIETYPLIGRILITGYADFNVLRDAINEAKIFQYVQKPWSEDYLRNAIEKALIVSHLEKENITLNSKLRASNKSLTTANAMLQDEIKKQKETEIKLRENTEELISAKGKAEESDRLKSAFLANMSHEVRTPMNAILGFSNLLKKEHLSNERKERYIGLIHAGGNRLLTIISNIVDASKIDANQLFLDNEECNLNELIDELSSLYSDLEQKEDIVLKVRKSLADNDSIISIDAKRLFQIISNLLENAYKFTEKGTIEFGYDLEGDNLKFFVADSGIGIDEHNHGHIFERFRRIDDDFTGIGSGNGLGLSIVKGLVELLDGQVWLESSRNKGATFYFTLPYQMIKNSKVDGSFADEGMLKTEEKISILIVEDELSNFLFLQELLEYYDCTITHAKNGKEAVDLFLDGTSFDLVFMDIKMPVMNGLDATLAIREFDKNIPIIAQTAYVMAEDEKKSMKVGCSDYISKPISEKALEKLVKKYMNKVRL